MSDSHAVGWIVAGAAAAGLVYWKRDAIASRLRLAPAPVRPGLAPALPPAPRPTPAGAPAVLDDAAALGRVITSEAGDGTPAERAAVGWIARNRASRRGVSIKRMVCSPECGPCCTGRPFSSARSAAARDLGLAIRILGSPQSADPTGGAIAFFEPALQDRLVAEGRPGYRFSATQVRARWRADGLTPVAFIGRFETWRKIG